jgi:predicted nucleic acid-binding protein
MLATDIPSGAVVAIDANVFLHHFTGQSKASTEVLSRVDSGDIGGVTTQSVLAEVMHRRMIMEAVERGLITPGNPARKLRENPAVVKGLTYYQQDVAGLYSIGLRVFPAHSRALLDSYHFRHAYGLLTNDSILAATITHHGISTLVTADRDFLRVKELDVVLLQDVG